MICLVAMVRLNALEYIETLWRSQGLGLNLGLNGVSISKALILLLYDPNPNPYDISSGYGETQCIGLYWDTMKIIRVRVELRVWCGTFQ